MAACIVDAFEVINVNHRYRAHRRQRRFARRNFFKRHTVVYASERIALRFLDERFVLFGDNLIFMLFTRGHAAKKHESFNHLIKLGDVRSDVFGRHDTPIQEILHGLHDLPQRFDKRVEPEGY